MDNADLVDGTAIGQQADMVRMSVDVSCSDAPQVLVRTHDGCRRCAGNTKERHTCGKRRAPPQGVAAVRRPSRQRTGKTDESRSATVILLTRCPGRGGRRGWVRRLGPVFFAASGRGVNKSPTAARARRASLMGAGTSNPPFRRFRHVK